MRAFGAVCTVLLSAGRATHAEDNGLALTPPMGKRCVLPRARWPRQGGACGPPLADGASCTSGVHGAALTSRTPQGETVAPRRAAHALARRLEPLELLREQGGRRRREGGSEGGARHGGEAQARGLRARCWAHARHNTSPALGQTPPRENLACVPAAATEF